MAEHGCLTMNEVGLIYRHQTHAYRVLKGLKDAELVGEFDTGLRPKTGYYLKLRGYRTLAERGQLRVKRRFKPEEFKAFIFPHRMACARVGIMLEDHPLVREFLPESLLWERRSDANSKLCDGEFLFQSPGWKRGRRVGLEVELTLKNSDKLRESFEGLARRGDLDQVWWLYGNPAVAKALAHWTERLGGGWELLHFMGPLDKFLESQAEFSLHDWQGQAYSITPDAPTLPENPEPPVRVEPAREHVRTELPVAVSWEPKRQTPEPAPAPQPAPMIEAEPWVWKKPSLRERIADELREFREVFWTWLWEPIPVRDEFRPGQTYPPPGVFLILVAPFLLMWLWFSIPHPRSWPWARAKKAGRPRPWISRAVIEPRARSGTAGEFDLRLASQGSKRHRLTLTLCTTAKWDVEVIGVHREDSAERPIADNRMPRFITKGSCARGGIDFDGPLGTGFKLLVVLDPKEYQWGREVLEVPIRLTRK